MAAGGNTRRPMVWIGVMPYYHYVHHRKRILVLREVRHGGVAADPDGALSKAYPAK